MKYLWPDETMCEKDDLEEYLSFMSDDFREVPDCFTFDPEEDQEWGGECYESECIWHAKDEPICGQK